jgi:hypothetical protein
MVGRDGGIILNKVMMDNINYIYTYILLKGKWKKGLGRRGYQSKAKTKN